MKRCCARFFSLLGCLLVASIVSAEAYSQTVSDAGKGRQSEVKKNISEKTYLPDAAPGFGEAPESFEAQKQQFIRVNGDLKLGRLIVSGLKRTRESVVRDAAGVKYGEPLSAFDVDQFVQNLYRTGLVMSVRINFVKSGDAVDVAVTLKEKWSLVPIPFAQYSGDTRGAGMFIMDANFLGLNKKAFLGFAYFNTGWMAMTSLVSPGNRSEDIFYAITAIGGRKDYRNTDMKKNTDVRYTANYALGNASIGYRFSSGFSAEISAGSSTFDVSEKTGAGADRIASSTFVKYACKFALNRQKFAPLRSTGFVSYLETNGYSRLSDGDVSSVSKFFINYSAFLFGSSVFSVYGSAGASSGSILLAQRIGGKICFKSLPTDMIVSDRYAGAGASLEVLAFDAKKAALYLVGEGEAGSFRSTDDDGDVSGFAGYGGGVRVYLKGVAFPALGVQVMRNQITGKKQTIVSVGFAF